MMTSSQAPSGPARHSFIRDATSVATKALTAMATKLIFTLAFFAPSVAHASYQDGAWGVMLCLFLVPATLIAIAAAAILRAAGAFKSRAVAHVVRGLAFMCAAVPLWLVLSANDTTSTVLVLSVDALALAILFFLARTPAMAAPEAGAQRDLDTNTAPRTNANPTSAPDP